MAFDTLQRWHETRHIDTSPMRISPAVRAPIVKQGPWAGINAALAQILPELDPVNIAKKRLALKAMPLQEAQINAQLQLLPMQQELQKRKMQMMMRGMNGGGIPGWELGPDGNWHKVSDAEMKRKQQAAEAAHNARILEDSLKHHIHTNGSVPTTEDEGANAAPPSDTPPGMAPSWADPKIFSGQQAGSPIPDVSQVAGLDEDQPVI